MVLRVAFAGLCQHNCLDAAEGRVPKEDSDRSVSTETAKCEPGPWARQQNQYIGNTPNLTHPEPESKPIRIRQNIDDTSQQAKSSCFETCRLHDTFDTKCRLAKCLVNALCETLSPWEADELFATKFAAEAATLNFLDPIGFESFMFL